MLLKYLLLVITIFLCFKFSFIQAKNNLEYSDINKELDYNHVTDPPLSFKNNIQLELKNCQQGKVIALNKVTATSQEIILNIGQAKYFGNITIQLHKCLKNLDPYTQDNYMLLTITEHKIDEEDPILLFQGWMISSSISVSTFEHAIYEILVKDCL